MNSEKKTASNKYWVYFLIRRIYGDNFSGGLSASVPISVVSLAPQNAFFLFWTKNERASVLLVRFRATAVHRTSHTAQMMDGSILGFSEVQVALARPGGRRW